MSHIRKDYIVSPYQNDQWVLQISQQYYIINNDSKKVLDIISSSENLEAARIQFNAHFKDDLSENQFPDFVKKIFTDIPIFDLGGENFTPQKSFIKFQKKIISAELAEKMVYPFQLLFDKKIFWVLFIFLSLLAITIIVKTPFPSVQETQLFWITILYTPTVFLHELGHIAACNKYTRQNGEIGFGIYFIFPVFYSDVSAIWHAKKEERVITNLAGIYLQMLSMLFFISLYFFVRNTLFLQMAFLLAVYSFIQLIPFIKSDGYWLLSDLSSTPNLQERSKTEMKLWLKKPIQKIKKSNLKEYFLLLYGIFNTLVFGYFVVTQIIYQWRDILNFPLYLYNSAVNVFTLNFSDVYLAPNCITIIIFYIICFRYMNKIWVKKHNL